jgi:dihydrolipoamide dehydrogenase
MHDMVRQALRRTHNGKMTHPHPTLGESIGMAAEVAHGSCTDVPLVRK